MKRILLALPIVAFAWFVASLSGCQNPASLLGPGGPEETEGDPARDAWVLPDEMGAIYAAQCAVCHGPDQRGSSLGPSLLGELTRGDSVEALVKSITEGAPNAGMPAWRDVISDDDVRGLVIYLLEKRAGDRGADGQGVGAPPQRDTHPEAVSRSVGALSFFCCCGASARAVAASRVRAVHC